MLRDAPRARVLARDRVGNARVDCRRDPNAPPPPCPALPYPPHPGTRRRRSSRSGHRRPEGRVRRVPLRRPAVLGQPSGAHCDDRRADGRRRARSGDGARPRHRLRRRRPPRADGRGAARRSFVGIDLSPRSIDEARAMAADLGLTNVTFHAADLRDLPTDAGDFDYIVAHGFYSWVPAPVRSALFETIHARLAPRGVAFVSHNVLPGLCAAPHRVGRAEAARRGHRGAGRAHRRGARDGRAHGRVDGPAARPRRGARDRVSRDRRPSGLRGAARRPRRRSTIRCSSATSWPKRARTRSRGSAMPTFSVTRRRPSASR